MRLFEWFRKSCKANTEETKEESTEEKIVDSEKTEEKAKSSNDDESSNDKKVRCFGSHRGGFILLHDGNIVGIFVDGKEKRLVFDDAVADIFIDPESTQTSGSFSVTGPSFGPFGSNL